MDKFEQEQLGDGLDEDERSELKRLRKEVKALKMECEILKKASVDSMGHCNNFIVNNPTPIASAASRQE